jgi:hypothetical protein
LALTRVVARNGQWEYRLNDAAPWTKVPAVAAVAGLLLGPTAQLRFVPKAGAANGHGVFDYKVIDDSITFVSGQRRATTATAFSKMVETATTAFGNSAPTFNAGPAPTFSKAVLGRAGQTLATLASRMTDSAGFQRGLAVSATSGNGSWEYSLDGGRTWKLLTGLSGSRLLLRHTDRVRFTPAVGFVGTASLTFAAWDRMNGVAGDFLPGTDASMSDELLTANATVA